MEFRGLLQGQLYIFTFMLYAIQEKKLLGTYLKIGKYFPEVIDKIHPTPVDQI
jgi:hypothetical protein